MLLKLLMGHAVFSLAYGGDNLNGPIVKPGKIDPIFEIRIEQPGLIPDPTLEICSLESETKIRIDPNRTTLDPKFFTKLLVLT